MRLNSLFGNSHHGKLFLGSPEAEAEVLSNSRMSLIDVYEDYHGLIPQLDGEKFIVIGRKGCGKSAFAEYLSASARSQPNLHCDFVRASDFTLEVAIQGEPNDGGDSAGQGLFRWLIYTRILKLFTQNEAIKESAEYHHLIQFLRKNSGYIDIHDYEIKELIHNNGFEVNVEHLRRFVQAKFKKDLQIRSEKAPYYKLLPHLEQVIQSALTSEFEKENENQYLLFFDDLDVWFTGPSQNVSDSIIALIRACRHINNEIFSKKGIQAKAVILLRDDIEESLSSRYADSAKIFATYSAKINWYQDDQEDRLNLKKFINKRIEFAFKRSEMPLLLQDPWACLISSGVDRSSSGKAVSSFKNVINLTMYRPRDLLLFFKPLEENDFVFPLTERNVAQLASAYTDELVKEVKNELASFYNEIQIECIFKAIAKISHGYPLYNKAVAIMQTSVPALDAGNVLDRLFDRSIVGIVDDQRRYWFKHRQAPGHANEIRLDQQKAVGVHYGIRAYALRVYGSA